MMTNLVQFPRLGLELEIDRVAFTLGGLNIYWYGIIIAAGLLLALVFAFHYAADFGVDADRLVDVVLVGTVCAIICARAYYVAFAPFKYDSIWDMINLRDGGIAIYGAVIGAAVFGGLACKWRKVPILPTFDLVAMGFLIGQGMGRWGNFFNQEAFGTNTNSLFGMYSRATHEYLTWWQESLDAGASYRPVLEHLLLRGLICAVGLHEKAPLQRPDCPALRRVVRRGPLLDRGPAHRLSAHPRLGAAGEPGGGAGLRRRGPCAAGGAGQKV